MEKFILSSESSLGSYSAGGSYFQELFILIFVLCILIVCCFFIRKYMGNTGIDQNSKIKIIERKSIGYNNFLLIVSVEDKYFLISQTKDRINLIDTLDEIQITKTEKNNFNNYLDRFIKKENKDSKEKSIEDK